MNRKLASGKLVIWGDIPHYFALVTRINKIKLKINRVKTHQFKQQTRYTARYIFYPNKLA